jgi:hypothetical protein
MAQKPTVAGGKPARGRGGTFVSRAAAPRLFLYGIVGLLLSLAIVFGVPQLQPTQVPAVAGLLGLSGAIIATAISGVLKVKFLGLVASGQLAVFALLYLGRNASRGARRAALLRGRCGEYLVIGY